MKRVPLNIINDIFHNSFRRIFEEEGFQFIVFISWTFYIFRVQLLLMQIAFRWKAVQYSNIVMICTIFHLLVQLLF